MELLVGTTHKEKAIVRLEGEIDHIQSATVFSYLSNILDGEVENLTLDFSGVRYMDSGAVNMVLQTHRILSERGSSLEIVGTNPWVQKILRITGAEGLIRFQNGEEDDQGPKLPAESSFMKKNFMIDPDLGKIRRVRKEVKDTLETMGLRGDICMDILVAISEAITNAVEHAVADHFDSLVSLVMKRDDSILVVEVLDQGAGFERYDITPDPGNSNSHRGRGIVLMEALSNRVEYNMNQEGFLVRMFFELE